MRNFVVCRAYTDKTICIFDGAKWISPLPLEYDLKIDCTKKEVNEDMQLLENLRGHKKLTILEVSAVLDTLKKKGVKFADIERSASILYPALIDYFATAPPPQQQPNMPDDGPEAKHSKAPLPKSFPAYHESSVASTPFSLFHQHPAGSNLNSSSSSSSSSSASANASSEIDAYPLDAAIKEGWPPEASVAINVVERYKSQIHLTYAAKA
jgi:hypothetical protein